MDRSGVDPVARSVGRAQGWRDGFAFVAVLVLSLLSGGCFNVHRKGIAVPLEHQYAVEDPQFLRSMGHAVGPGLEPGNQVTCLVNGDQIFPAMMEAVRGAKESINLETYIYWSGEVGRQFAEALAERARAGVKVHLLMDWLGSRKVNPNHLAVMRAAGVEVIKYNPLVIYNLSRLNYRDHRKLLIVDGRIGFTGGAGLADIWLGNADTPGHWRDNMYRLEGPAVAQMQAAFLDNWMKASSVVLDGPAYFPELAPAGDHIAQVFKSSPREGTEEVRLMYLLSIAAAKTNIRISASYFVPGGLTTDGLIAACHRGVRVEIILPGARTDSPLVRYASRARWGPLLKAGVKIYEYQPTMYHCKYMIVDDLWVSVGSANFDNRSFRLNDEANLNVFSREFAASQVALFESDKERSREVTYEDWKGRSFLKKILERFTGPFRSML